MRDPVDDLSNVKLHPQLYHAGWVWNGLRRYHYFMPGMNVSECGRVTCKDDAARKPKVRSRHACGVCQRSIIASNRKMRAALAP